MKTDKIPAVASFDINKYLGKWYEIARLPNRFEKNLEKVTAEYRLLPEGEIEVINRGFNITDNEWEEAKGKAWIPDPNTPSILKVSFFFLISSEYRIIYLDREDYKYAMVTSSSREYLWILSRQPQLNKTIFAKLVDFAGDAGFEVEKLHIVKH